MVFLAVYCQLCKVNRLSQYKPIYGIWDFPSVTNNILHSKSMKKLGFAPVADVIIEMCHSRYRIAVAHRSNDSGSYLHSDHSQPLWQWKGALKQMFNAYSRHVIWAKLHKGAQHKKSCETCLIC